MICVLVFALFPSQLTSQRSLSESWNPYTSYKKIVIVCLALLNSFLYFNLWILILFGKRSALQPMRNVRDIYNLISLIMISFTPLTFSTLFTFPLFLLNKTASTEFIIKQTLPPTSTSNPWYISGKGAPPVLRFPPALPMFSRNPRNGKSNPTTNERLLPVLPHLSAPSRRGQWKGWEKPQ